MKTYLVKECFRTIQGEGTHAGTPAVFVRFVGCNMWSGDDADRVRDSQRNEAQCPLWCDTDFTALGAQRYTAEEVAKLIESRMHPTRTPLVVLTGGEPLLQVDGELLLALDKLDVLIAIETNGTAAPKFQFPSVGYNKPWVTLSPKQEREKLQLPVELVDELKLVYPAYDPAEWNDFPAAKFLQPQALSSGRWDEHEQQAAALVIDNGTWRLSLQTHKIVRVP